MEGRKFPLRRTKHRSGVVTDSSTGVRFWLVKTVVLGVVKLWKTDAVLDEDGEVLHLHHWCSEETRTQSGAHHDRPASVLWQLHLNCWCPLIPRSSPQTSRMSSTGSSHFYCVDLCRTPAFDLAGLLGVVEGDASAREDSCVATDKHT